jgi:glycosyltransferase involved in cell wall biosynthesis
MALKGISIILCTHNGESRLTKTLEHLCNLIPVDAVELIIVDNVSSDNTFNLCNTYLNFNCSFQWRIVHEEKPGLVHARFKGITEALYNILLFCDDDNYLSPEYIKTGYDIIINNDKIGALGGNGRPVFYSLKPDWFDRYSYSYAVGPQAHVSGKLTTSHPEIYGAASFWRKDVLIDMYSRGFKALLTGRRGNVLVSGDDVEWCYMINLLGYEIWYDEYLLFEHVMPEGRLKWDYYLKLKKGIASGSALLFPYELLIRNKNIGLLNFKIHYSTQTIISLYQYIRFRSYNFIKGNLRRPQQVADVVLKNKMLSFLTNYKIAKKQFQLLLSII